jgi:hypothetical protein
MMASLRAMAVADTIVGRRIEDLQVQRLRPLWHHASAASSLSREYRIQLIAEQSRLVTGGADGDN